MSKKRLVFIDIDGINPQVLYDMLDEPGSNLGRIAGRGARVERAVTVFPAVTLCCQASMFTGTWPGTHGILGNSWWDRFSNPPRFRYYTDARTAMGNYGYAMFGWPTLLLPRKPGLQFANDDLSKSVETIYEMAHRKGLRSMQVFNQYSRGVDNWVVPSRTAMILFALAHEELLHNRHWDKATFAHLFRAMRKGGELPDLIAFYISGHDNNSHEHGAHDQAQYFKNFVDPLFGRFITEFEKHAPLEDLYFLITSDHGQANTIKDQEHVVDHALLGQILGAVGGGGFQLAARKKVLPTDTAIGNMEAGATQFHLINRETFNWADPPRFEQDIMPVAEAFSHYGKSGGRPPFVDLLLVRPAPDQGYMVFENGALTDLETYFADKDEIYPDAVRRVRGLECKRSGDIIVILDYSQGYYFGDKPKAGEHGNLCAADALIPFVVSGPGIADQTIPFASLIDAVPTAGALLGFDTSKAQGRSILPPGDE